LARCGGPTSTSPPVTSARPQRQRRCCRTVGALRRRRVPRRPTHALGSPGLRVGLAMARSVVCRWARSSIVARPRIRSGARDETNQALLTMRLDAWLQQRPPQLTEAQARITSLVRRWSRSRRDLRVGRPGLAVAG